MLSSSELRKGTLFEYEGAPYRVISYEHDKRGRGQAVVRVGAKNILSGAVRSLTFKGDQTVGRASIEKRECQFLYEEGGQLHFMDTKTYDQFALTENEVGDDRLYIKEGESYTIAYYKGKAVGLELPTKVPLKVTQADVGLRGDTANNPTKTVTLETGLKVQAPLFIKPGDILLIDTRDASYAERA